MSQNTQSTSNIKIALSGGHAATSALAIIEKVQEKHPKWETIWIGSSNAFAKEKATTLDFQLFPSMGVKCYSIKSGKLQRSLSIASLIDLLKIPIGITQSIVIMFREKPNLLLSFGGFAAFPPTFVAWLFGIPVLIHEQTVAIGLANKLSLPFVKEVLLSREQSRKYFKKYKTRVVGLPLHSALINLTVQLNKSPKTIYITGGSRGSHIINTTLKGVIPELLSRYKVIHQTGSLDETEQLRFKKTLSKELQKKYNVRAHFMPNEIAKIYEEADIVIGRAGAHTVAEVVALNKAAIFIPIPWVQMNEQFLNAELAHEYTDALIINEDELNVKTLSSAIKRIENEWGKRMVKKYDNKISKKDRNAASKIVSVIEEYVR